MIDLTVPHLVAITSQNAVRSQARPGVTFPADEDITAADAPNAAKLTAEGFIASPQTAWTTGQKITIGTFNFNWTGSAWAAGTHALLRSATKGEVQDYLDEAGIEYSSDATKAELLELADQ